MPHKDPIAKRIYSRAYYARKGKEYHREYYYKNRDKCTAINRKCTIKRKYGITLEEVENMRKTQDSNCAICKRKLKLYIDHDHETGKVRGLLCHSCNIFLGIIRDGKYLNELMDYVRRNKNV